jgi:hypothetical protein
VIVSSAVNKSPLATLAIAGAETLDMFRAKFVAAVNLVTTPEIIFSIPARFP